MINEIKKHVTEYIEITKSEGRKRIETARIEEYVIKKTGGRTEYEKFGGYYEFHGCITFMQNKGIIRAIKNSDFNGMNPPLKTRWSVVYDNRKDGWPASFIMKVSDYLDMTGYVRNPNWQTDGDKRFIERIHNFLKNADNREWASCEERCLELFDNEKFLSLSKSRILTRLGITYEELKMMKYGQMFSYWISNRRKTEKVIILENHSTFFSFKRIAEKNLPIFNIVPDLLIFGDGKRIIKSLGFLNEITNPELCNIKYFGDMDPEGWLIYKLLKEKYDNLDISFFMPAYRFLIDSGKEYPMGDVLQNTNKSIVEYIIKEFKKAGMDYYNNDVMRLWEKRRRIPQELLTYERLLKDSSTP
jgi:hypothetical protein